MSLLRHLLQILGISTFSSNHPRSIPNSLIAGKATNPILTLETAQSIFVPTLPEAGCQTLGYMLSMFPHVPKGTYSWGNALAINTSSVEETPRSKGTAFCTLNIFFLFFKKIRDELTISWCLLGSGWTNTFHFIDPTGVAAVFGTQILPTMDADVLKACLDFENALYAGLA